MRVYGVTFDISMQRADEERLSLSERRYRALVESTSALVWSADANGKIRPSNSEWERFTGTPREKLSGWGWLEFTYPDDRERIYAAWLDAIREGVGITLTFRMRQRDQDYRIVQAHAAPLYDEQGQLQEWEWFGTTTDVTPQYEAQAAIEARSLRLTVAMQAAKIHILSIELKSRTLLFETDGEPQVSETLTYDAALARVHPDDSATLDRYLRHLAAGEEPSGLFEFRVQNNPHREQWMQGSALLQRDANGEPLRIIGCLIDITDRKLMELMLREAGRRKDEFLAMLAHELRNPLAPLRIVIALLQKDDDMHTHRRELVSLMSRQVEHMTRIVDDLLEVSRITQGRIALQLEPILVGTAVYHAVEAIAGMMESRAQHIAVDVTDTTAWVCGDVTRLSQILVNVLNNASKYTPEMGRITVSTNANDEHVAIVIADTGTGISADLLPKVFELFSQSESTLDRSNGGLVIGLSLVKKLIEMHKGTITVQSPGPGLGMTVTVRLPRLHHHERYSALALSDTDAPAHEKHQALRILVVYDNRDAADSLAMLCESEGHVAQVIYSSSESF
ncbi:Chemotaxis protein methyltransferase CheR [Candidatus Burkholderia pumila]|uniref:histidine kinase n=1 Tax=Candidatus Burkholderia pumila TaxID=1090375 RepID=A0ABR5HM50_9BURK|nr:Chemotaxis protein methyltransferase CheR [Candidatus Burkholderia pumila]